MNHIELSINALFPRRFAAAHAFPQEAAVIKSNLLETERSLKWSEISREVVPVRPVTGGGAAAGNWRRNAGKCSDLPEKTGETAAAGPGGQNVSGSFAPVLTGQRTQAWVGGFRGGTGSDQRTDSEDMRGAEKEPKQTSKRVQGCGEKGGFDVCFEMKMSL